MVKSILSKELAGDSRSEGNELNTRSVASLGLGPHASVDTFHTVMTDDPE